VKTIGSVLDEHKGIGPGFDAMRLALAFLILVMHSIVAVDVGIKAEYSAIWFAHFAMVPMFFALSGFLISGSAMRLRLRDFLLNRSFRILPALAVEILVSALILGPLVTSFSLSAYFSDPKFFHYFTNIIGWIQYELPGVFLKTPTPRIVNISLWTVPYEVLCYVIMSAIIIFGLLRRPLVLIAAFVLWTIIPLVFLALHIHPSSGDGPLGKLLVVLFVGRGTLLFQSFLVGCLMYVYRHRIPVDRRIFVACLVFFMAVTLSGSELWGPPELPNTGVLNALACIPLVYITVFLGVCDLGQVPLYSTGDYSYGIYLYGFPVQQTLAQIMPAGTSLWVHLALTTVIVTAIAMVSWHWIEKPILKLRRNFSFMARKTEEPMPAQDVAPLVPGVKVQRG
jgi:peptidoglycan/LPS O-acetylase OafA/YrhL